MAPSCHTPAAKSSGAADPPAEEPAWKTKKAKKEPVSDPSGKVLIQDGWSVPVVQTFEYFRTADTGVCPATRSEAEEGDP